MKKVLLSILAMLTTMGAWAALPAAPDIPPHLEGSCTEDAWDSNGYATEDVLIIDLSISSEAEKNRLATYFKKNQENNYEINHSKYEVVVIKGEITQADLATLNSIPERTIDLQDATWANGVSKEILNPNVVNLILPDGWTKEEVNAVGSAIGSLEGAKLGSCISQEVGTTSIDGVNGSTLRAYVNKGNTLYEVMRHVYTGSRPNTKLRGGDGVDKDNPYFDKIKTVVISGNPVARDLTGGFTDLKYGENGHFVFDVPAVEAATQTRTLTGTTMIGALCQCEAVSLDLSDAVIPEEYNEDLTLSITGLVGTTTQEVIIPTSPEVKTLPADFLNISCAIRQICIPRNIENIKTRAFYATVLDHIWTTGPDTQKTDNGIITGFDTEIDSDGNEIEVEHKVYGHLDLLTTTPQDKNTKWYNYLYGTYTFSDNLKLIESYSFGISRDVKVKDVYVLAIHAPECHVNAFPALMYVANDEYDVNAINENGIITREAYMKSYQNPDDQYRWMTMLHYPRECETPDIQRYTDPTREYSIATGLKDGKGGTIYFPTQPEYKRAFDQGTYGYVWMAWDDTRKDDGSMWIEFGPFAPNTYSAENQQAANDLYIANTNENKYDRVFYDTTFGGQLPRIEGQKEYTQVEWLGQLLYPGAVIEYGDYIYVDDENGDYVLENGEYRLYAGSADDGLPRYSRKKEQVLDAYGYRVYEKCDEGTLVQDWSYEKDDNGDLIWDVTFTEDPNGQVVKDFEYVKYTGVLQNDETYYYHPMIRLNTSSRDNWNQYYTIGYIEDENGNYINANENNPNNPNPDYITIQEAINRNWTEAVIATYTHYSTGYKRFTSISDYDSNSWKGVYILSDSYKVYQEGAEDYAANLTDIYVLDFQGYHEYDANNDNGKPRYNVVDNGFVTATSGDEAKQHYSKQYKAHIYREFNPEIDPTDEPRYCPKMVEVKEVKSITKQNDYRGWHQFVLTGYAYTGTDDIVPFRSYINDNDWWTICLPFNLTKAELIKLYGTESENEANQKIPYLSKLTYVIRDVENQKIKLMFSNNLLEYKETVAEGKVHGTIATTAGGVGMDDVVLHRGVPYLIRPYLTKGTENSFKRQFDIQPTGEAGDLYTRIKESQTMPGDFQKQLVYNGEYTVPAYVVYNAGEAVVSNDLTLTMGDGTEFTHPKSGSVKYIDEDGNAAMVDYNVSDAFTYTFVGSFYLSLMPQYSYFLGWNSDTNKAAFWYNRVADPANWTWANETGIICANWNSNLEIHAATNTSDPARWIVSAGTDMKNDDFKTSGGQTNNAKYYDMDFGAETPTAISEITTSDAIKRVQNGVFSVDGVYLGTSTSKLAKGIYIVNGKKYVVK